MKSLEQIPPTWDQVLPAGERFKVVMGGEAVLDRETGLVWQRVPPHPESFPTPLSWKRSGELCRLAETGGRMGWRLATVEELFTLVDPSSVTVLPVGHPFDLGPSPSWYFWTADVDPQSPALVGLTNLHGRLFVLTNTVLPPNPRLWCVRGGR
jgi:hypothetical protein